MPVDRVMPVDRILDKRLVIVAGKGGTGRTTVAAALALAAARNRKRVLICQTKSKDRLPALFGCGPVGSSITSVRENLSAVNMTPEMALREYGTMVLRSQFVARQVLENKISRAFLHAIPGLEDYSMLGKVWYHCTDAAENGRWDLVILDGPATGHLINMLRIPQAILDAVPEGPLTRPAADCLRLLRDPARTAMLLVTLAEELPVTETVELADKARSLVGLSLGPVVVNQLYPPRFAQGPSARALTALEHPGAGPLTSALRTAHTAARRRALQEEHMAQLKSRLPEPQIHLPVLFRETFGPRETGELSDRLEQQLAALA